MGSGPAERVGLGQDRREMAGGRHWRETVDRAPDAMQAGLQAPER